MNQHLQSLLNFFEQDTKLSAEDKIAIIKSLKDGNKELEITAFKLDRTEKVKRTTAILLEETIEELEQKRKAVEAQNRELEIESSLERVRTVAMGMRKLDDMLDVCHTISQQLELLNVKDIRNVQTAIIYESKGTYLNYEYYAKHDLLLTTEVDFKNHTIQEKFANQMLKGAEELFTESITGKELPDWYAYQKTTNQFADSYLETAESLTYYWYSLGPVALGMSTYAPLSEAEIILFKRFRNVFELAYRRFNDIEQAIAQAKEAQIETSLERVRSRSLAMQKSEELKEVIQVVYEQFVHLNVNTEHTGFVIDYKLRDDRLIRVASKYGVPSQLTIPYFDCEYYNSFNEAKDKGWDFFASNLSFEDKNNFYRELFKYIPGLPEDAKEFYFNCRGLAISTVLLENVGLYIENFEGTPYSDEDNSILMRFGKVFQQTYTRFLDLEKAEAQAREARIAAALERVRSRTLAMQRSEELVETAAVLFQQLIALGIEPNRLYISIINSEQGETEFWITDEEGRKVSTAFTAKMQDNATFLKMYEGWKQQQKSMVIDMQGEELQNYFRHLTGLGVSFKGGLEQKRRIQEIAYFSKGFIGMASPEEQPAETLELLERFAAVFNLTFTRFNDLKMAEAHARQAELDLIAIKEAKLKAEEALSVLQATQKQLVQAEKMASLGELTAGIAHEIQNPLNFVNNFSEVSQELVKEMNDELTVGNWQLAKEIMNDVIQNLEKINHHGKRADGIVKGMLQHSRSSSGVKEPTDINALADEYLRLAYHGLRAKDKSFNATLKTEFDDTIGNINVIPQDIGRVILNLITNAFYAVDEKKKQQPPGYEPTVTVTTRKLNTSSGEAGVVISVNDNGNGITRHVIDKIFQPFFTTKPTGQGTGLGLSLSYDIVKAHGGELKVETTEGEGSGFIITLPV